MHPNAQLIQRFFTAFQRKDAETMAACYHPAARFSDPVFPQLEAAEAADMWRMFCSNAELDVQFRDVQADDRRGSAHWDARYTFTPTKRKVLNPIDSAFEFQDGKIFRHTDTFSFPAWARQALGPVGLFLGWTPLVKGKVRTLAAKSLTSFRAGRQR